MKGNISSALILSLYSLPRHSACVFMKDISVSFSFFKNLPDVGGDDFIFEASKQQLIKTLSYRQVVNVLL